MTHAPSGAVNTIAGGKAGKQEVLMVTVTEGVYCQSMEHRPRYAVFQVTKFDGQKVRYCKECFKEAGRNRELGDADKVDVIRRGR